MAIIWMEKTKLFMQNKNISKFSWPWPAPAYGPLGPDLKNLGPRVQGTPSHLRPNLHAGKGGWDFYTTVTASPNQRYDGRMDGKGRPPKNTAKRMTQWLAVVISINWREIPKLWSHQYDFCSLLGKTQRGIRNCVIPHPENPNNVAENEVCLSKTPNEQIQFLVRLAPTKTGVLLIERLKENTQREQVKGHKSNL